MRMRVVPLILGRRRALVPVVVIRVPMLVRQRIVRPCRRRRRPLRRYTRGRRPLMPMFVGWVPMLIVRRIVVPIRRRTRRLPRLLGRGRRSRCRRCRIRDALWRGHAAVRPRQREQRDNRYPNQHRHRPAARIPTRPRLPRRPAAILVLFPAPARTLRIRLRRNLLLVRHKPSPIPNPLQYRFSLDESRFTSKNPHERPTSPRPHARTASSAAFKGGADESPRIGAACQASSDASHNSHDSHISCHNTRPPHLTHAI